MIARKYLHNFYNNKKLSEHIHLEGGAALSLYYNINRKFSNDLDFTIESQDDMDRFRENIIKPFNSDDYFEKHINKNKTCVYNRKGKIILTFDYYLAKKQFCHYEEMLLDGVTPSLIHSVADILTEKLCCMIDRDTEKDVHDAATILVKYSSSIDIISGLYNKKQEVKKSCYPKLEDLTRAFSLLAQQKRNWVFQGANLNIIKDYLENNAIIKP